MAVATTAVTDKMLRMVNTQSSLKQLEQARGADSIIASRSPLGMRKVCDMARAHAAAVPAGLAFHEDDAAVAPQSVLAHRVRRCRLPRRYARRPGDALRLGHFADRPHVA